MIAEVRALCRGLRRRLTVALGATCLLLAGLILPAGLTRSVTPWLRLGAGPFKVEPPMRLTSSGTFRWSAKTSAAAQVYVTQGSVTSNTLTIRAR